MRTRLKKNVINSFGFVKECHMIIEAFSYALDMVD